MIMKNLGLQSLASRPTYSFRRRETSCVPSRCAGHEPTLYSFDEPTAYLDPAGRRRVLSTMKLLHHQGIGILHITHDVNDIADADRLLVMDKGRIILDGPPEHIM